MAVPEEINTFATTDRLLDGPEAEEATSPVDRNEKIRLSTLSDAGNLPKEIDAGRDDDDSESNFDANRDDDNSESILDADCHEGDRLSICCFDVDTSVCDNGIEKLLCKTDDFLKVYKVTEFLCGPEGDPCFDVDHSVNCSNLIDADYGGDDKCGKLGDAGTEIQHKEVENKEEVDIADNTANISTGEVVGNEGAPHEAKEEEDEIVMPRRETEARERIAAEKAEAERLAQEKADEAAAFAKALEVKKEQERLEQETLKLKAEKEAEEQRIKAKAEEVKRKAAEMKKREEEAISVEKAETERLEPLEVEKEKAEEAAVFVAAAAAAAAAAAVARAANLEKEQPTNQDERMARLKAEFERLEQEYAAALSK